MYPLKPMINVLAAGLLSVLAVAMPARAEEGTAEAIPASAGSIWEAIDQHMATLGRLVESGSLEEVHHQAFAIRDLVAALPARSSGLEAAQAKTLDADVKFVAVLAQRLDASGDSNDREGAKASLEKLKRLLDSMRTTDSGTQQK